MHELERTSPSHFSMMKERLNELPLLSYLLHNVETTVASASEEIMILYAECVEDPLLRGKYMDLILGEFSRTREMLIKIFGSTVEIRRPNVVKTIALREPSLSLLHRMQICQLKEWRRSDLSDSQQREVLLRKIFATINAIAGGLRNTG